MKSKRVGKPTFFIVFILILALTFCAFFGIQNYRGDTRQIYVKGAEDIRWGIDIRGGVEAVFSPDKEDVDITSSDMDSARAIIETRLVNNNITDYEVYTDNDNNQIIVRFPWAADESDFDAVAAVREIGETALLTFCKGDTNEDVILSGAADIKSAQAAYDQENNQPVVQLKLTEAGTVKFATATAEQKGKTISIWMDDVMLSAPTVNEVISNGEAVITGMADAEAAKDLADKINAGSLPFALTVDDSKLQVISPTLGADALRVMVMAGAIAFALVCLLMIFRYRLNGVVTSIALLGQLAGMIACISGFFSGIESFTLTIPGIAGIILSIGVGVDCNVIAAERIRDEFKKGKTIDGAIDSGFKNSLSAIIDGNVTIIIVALVLMGAFGTPDNIIAKFFSPIMSLFGSQVTGAIYSFGYTLLVGTIFNLVMGVWASKLMLKSISQLKPFRKLWLYGGKKAEATAPKAYKLNTNKVFKPVILVYALIFIAGTVFAVVGGVDLDINFSGGAKVSYSYTGEVAEADIEAVADEVLGTKYSLTKSTALAGDTQTFEIALSGKNALTAEKQEELTKQLTEKLEGNEISLYNSNSVGASVAGSFFAKSLVAVIITAALVVLYVGIRFRRIGGVSAGLTALVALIFDVLITFFVCVFFGLQIDTNFMAVVLTMLGYSLNDTIVVYDRVRENRKLNPDGEIGEVVNVSINQTLIRNVVTTVTTFLAVTTIVVVSELFGLTSLRSFAIPMAFGLVSGAISSLLVSGPLWVIWQRKKLAKQAK